MADDTFTYEDATVPDSPIFDDMQNTGGQGAESEIAPDPTAARKEPPGVKALRGLGKNKQRGGPRALLKRDEDALTRYYILIGMALAPIRPQLGAAFAAQADQCSKAWVEVGKENDSVRRVILWLVEGGAWGALFLAHLPIAFAAVPEEALPDIIKQSLGAFSPNGEGDADSAQMFQFPTVRHPEAT